jgi:hypothetical protein
MDSNRSLLSRQRFVCASVRCRIVKFRRQFQIQSFWSLKPLIYRLNQAPLRGFDRLKRRKSVLNLELLKFRRLHILRHKSRARLNALKVSVSRKTPGKAPSNDAEDSEEESAKNYQNLTTGKSQY